MKRLIQIENININCKAIVNFLYKTPFIPLLLLILNKLNISRLGLLESFPSFHRIDFRFCAICFQSQNGKEKTSSVKSSSCYTVSFIIVPKSTYESMFLFFCVCFYFLFHIFRKDVYNLWYKIEYCKDLGKLLESTNDFQLRMLFSLFSHWSRCLHSSPTSTDS